MGGCHAEPRPVVVPREMPYNIYAIGRTGVGKSTLLNCLLSYNKSNDLREVFRKGSGTGAVTQSIEE